MQRRFMLLGIADRSKCVLSFERDSSQRLTAEGNGDIGEVAPIWVVTIVLTCGVIEREPNALDHDE
jgi:hypothetical protein